MGSASLTGGQLAGMTVLGVGQAAGAAMLVAGFVVKSSKLVRNVAPVVGGSAVGLSIHGAL
jgi:hypothetical protein